MTTAVDDANAELEPAEDPRVGRLVANSYRVIRPIATGGMGAVYEATQERIGRRFALKFLRADLCADPKMVARFEREARAAGALENEHICAIVDVLIGAEDAPCIVMEYLDGENLARLLDTEGPLPVPRAVELVRQVCRGLSEAHAHGVIHRDLKPKNLIVCKRADRKDLVKIVDFGIAKLADRNVSESSGTTTGVTLGTPHYMSPEQARGEKKLDHRADIYALGVILYELLSAEKPHPGDSYNAIIYHILSKPPVPLREHRPEIPEALARVVHRALASEPEARFDSVVELEKALAPYAPGAPDRLGASASTLPSALLAGGTRARRVPRNLPLLLAIPLSILLAYAWSQRPTAAGQSNPKLPAEAPEAKASPAEPSSTAAVAASDSVTVAVSASSVASPASSHAPAPTRPSHQRSPPAGPASARPPIDWTNPY